ncbi:hypothetical protein POM88_044029 [Heracleum sosnowskyi]|uniref:Calmodulin binding protein-like N-terminal domain-containing protein n=1 Tax=Heracleum sosnowskyi TaxID=360622 RepID=A0AAD8H224_9APIA|nr:hypothetical protein POM88_044029 [Heracleum sosnowskyi]
MLVWALEVFHAEKAFAWILDGPPLGLYDMCKRLFMIHGISSKQVVIYHILIYFGIIEVKKELQLAMQNQTGMQSNLIKTSSSICIEHGDRVMMTTSVTVFIPHLGNHETKGLDISRCYPKWILDRSFYTEKLAISTEHCVPAPSASRIEVQQDTKMELALIDTSTGEMVSYGPISSEKVEILVIVGDFDDDMGNKWKHEKFNSNFVRVRKRKKALIMGDVVLNLRDGVGLLGDIYYYR